VSDSSKPSNPADLPQPPHLMGDQTDPSAKDMSARLNDAPKPPHTTDAPKPPNMPDIPKQTQLLSDQSDTGPMEQREPRPGTTQLGPGWRLRFKINDQTTVIEIGGKVVVGRVIDDEPGVDFDLTPFGAYHYGVSRQHALLSMHEGFLYLEDNGSTNGTRINGFQMTPHQKYRLRDGDEIEFARLRTNIRFERPGSR
jgi:hypothetical protein